MPIFVICIGPYPILETWPSIYRGQEGTVWGRLKASQVEHPSLLSINKSVEPNEEQKVLMSSFDQGITVNTSKQVFRGIW